ncbi:MAG: hypothetical protein ACI9XP_001968 [Lentimonas sp.]|jgi:hypothetical protein
MSSQDWLKKSKFFAYLTPPVGVNVREREQDFIWMTDDNILCSVPIDNVKVLTIEESNVQLKEFQDEFGTEKIRMVSVINPNAKSTKEIRDWAADILPEIIDKIGIISDSPLGRMAIKLFIGLRPPTYGIKVFKTAEDAFAWIRE